MNSHRPPVSRRDLLRRWNASSPEGAAPPSRGELLRASRQAMGTSFEVRLPSGSLFAADLACRALDRIDELEAQMTVYREDSELSRLNQTAHEEPVHVERGLFEIISRAVAISHQTDGAYDVTSGVLSRVWGFMKGPKRVPSVADLAIARDLTGSGHLRLDPQAQTIAFDRPGIEINLGSIGKGYAIDEATRVVRKALLPVPALIHGGHSSLYALGSPPETLVGRWRIALRNPFDPDRPLGQFGLRDRALGSSGAAFQQFEEGGRLYGHILDPRTGEPPREGPASVTVLAPSAADADALSTAFYLLGRERATEILQDHPQIGVAFVEALDFGRSKTLTTIHIPDSEFQADLAGLVELRHDRARGQRVYRILDPSPRHGEVFDRVSLIGGALP